MNDFLQKAIAAIKNLFPKGTLTSDSIVGLDIGAESIKVVQIKKEKNKALLETYGSIALGPFGEVETGKSTNLQPEIIGKAIVELFKAAGITSTNVQCVIPAYSSLVFVVSLPGSISGPALKEVVPTEARKYIPVPIADVAIDWFVLPEPEAFDVGPGEVAPVLENKTEVLVVAILNEVVNRYRDALTTANVSAVGLEVESFSQVRSVFTHELAPVMLLDMGASKTKLSIVEYGIVKSVHVINRGSADITQNIATSLNVPFSQAEIWKHEYGMKGEGKGADILQAVTLSTDYILSETNSTMVHYERTHNRAISKVILTGGGVLMKGFFEKAQESFRSEIVLANPFYKLESPAFLVPTLEKIGPEFAGAVGVALRGVEM